MILFQNDEYVQKIFLNKLRISNVLFRAFITFNEFLFFRTQFLTKNSYLRFYREQSIVCIFTGMSENNNELNVVLYFKCISLIN